MIVDPDDAGLDGCSDAVRASNVAGADRGCKAKRRVVGELERFGFVREPRHDVKGPNTSS